MHHEKFNPVHIDRTPDRDSDHRYYITGYSDDYNNLLIILLCI